MTNENTLTERELIIIKELVNYDRVCLGWSNALQGYYYYVSHLPGKRVFDSEYNRLLGFGLIEPANTGVYYPTLLARRLYTNEKTGAEKLPVEKRVKRSSFGVKIEKFLIWCLFSSAIMFLVLLILNYQFVQAGRGAWCFFGGHIAGGFVYWMLKSWDDIDRDVKNRIDNF